MPLAFDLVAVFEEGMPAQLPPACSSSSLGKDSDEGSPPGKEAEDGDGEVQSAYSGAGLAGLGALEESLPIRIQLRQACFSAAANRGRGSNMLRGGSNRGRGASTPHRGRGPPAGRGASTGQGRGRSNSDNRPICQVCHKKGHVASDCWYRYDETYTPEDKTAAAATHAYGVDTNWYLDTGATDHITGELEKLTTSEPYKGNDQIHTASGAGSSNEKHSA